MNVWKKVSMLTLVVALAMSFCVMAGASEQSATLTAAATTATDNGLNEIIFGVKLADTVASTPRPGTKFTYTVAADTGNATGAPIVAFNSTQTDAKVAVANGTATVTFPVDNTGADATATVSLTIANAADNAAMRGEFSYTITQSALSDTAVTAGFKSNGTDGSTVAYTLKLAVNGTKVTQAALYSDTANNTKVVGFETNTYTAAGAVEVTKYVVKAGNEGKDGYFDFRINIPTSSSDDVNMVGLNVAFNTANNANTNSNSAGFANASQTLTSEGTTFNGVLKASDGGRNLSGIDTAIATGNTLSISNLPGGVDVVVTETYAYADNGYTLKTSSKSGESYAPLADDANGAVTITTVSGSAVGVKFFNILEDISLTGVTLRYAPYLLTLGAGITVLPLTRSYKKREED